MTQYSTFYLGERRFGLPILAVREIIRTGEITPVPLAAPHIRGLLNLRGQTVTILDLGVCLGMAGGDADSGGHVVVLGHEDRAGAARPEGGAATPVRDLAGFLVDAIGDVLEADPAQLEPAPANVFDTESRFIHGVVKTPAGLLVLLDLAAVLGHRPEPARA